MIVLVYAFLILAFVFIMGYILEKISRIFFNMP